MKNGKLKAHAPVDSSPGGMCLFAVVVPGLEGVAASELSALAAHDVQAVEGGVTFTGSMDVLCRVNLRSRTATRVLLRLGDFKALSFPELYNKTKKIDWARYIPEGRAVQVKASCHGSKLMHSGRAEQAVRDALADRLAQAGVSLAEDGQAQLVTVRLQNDRCSISLDSSGERLDRRGYRLLSGHAPIRETMAAGILQWMDWKPEEPLLVPMCGSGTFAIEAALIARGRAVGLDHDFALLHWPALNAKRWQRVQGKAAGMLRDAAPCIQAGDLGEAVLEQSGTNAQRAGVKDCIRFGKQDVRAMQPPAGAPGLIVCNPPYGERIKGNAQALYRDLGALMQQDAFRGWRMAVIVPDQACENALNMPVKRRLKLKHGGLWVHVLHVEGGSGG